MNHSPARILAELLHSGVLETGETHLFEYPAEGTDWCLYTSSLPDETDRPKCAAVYDTTPIKQGRLMDGTELWAHGIQFKLRSPDYASGWAKGEALVDYLMSLHNVSITVDTTQYLIEYFSQSGRLMSLGQDEQRRCLFSINGTCVIEVTVESVPLP